MANKTVKVDIASVLLQEAAKVGDFVLQYQTMNDLWAFQYLDLMQDGEYFYAPTAQDVLVSAIAHGNNPDWLDEKVPTQQIRPTKRAPDVGQAGQ